MMNQFIDIKKSGIHRHGVFAKIPIPKGTDVIEYVGKKVTKEEGTRRLEETTARHNQDPEHAYTYIFELDDKYDIDGDVPENDAKYINHSCNPNCIMDIRQGHIWIKALRDIEAGEELAYNYGFGIDEDDLYNFKEQPCLCDSKRCVGYILDEKEWPRMRELLEKEGEERKNFSQTRKLLK